MTDYDYMAILVGSIILLLVLGIWAMIDRKLPVAFSLNNAVLIVLAGFTFNFMMEQQKTIDDLTERTEHQVIVYQADNYGSSVVGTVESKSVMDNTYYVTVDGYNWQINQSAWLQVEVGDRVVGQMKGGK